MLNKYHYHYSLQLLYYTIISLGTRNLIEDSIFIARLSLRNIFIKLCILHNETRLMSNEIVYIRIYRLRWRVFVLCYMKITPRRGLARWSLRPRKDSERHFRDYMSHNHHVYTSQNISIFSCLFRSPFALLSTLLFNPDVAFFLFTYTLHLHP